jgi:hypothetical protein
VGRTVIGLVDGAAVVVPTVGELDGVTKNGDAVEPMTDGRIIDPDSGDGTTAVVVPAMMVGGGVGLDGAKVTTANGEEALSGKNKTPL